MNKLPKRLLSLTLALILALTLAPANLAQASVGAVVNRPLSAVDNPDGLDIPSLEDWIAATFPDDGETDPVTDDADNDTDPVEADVTIPPVADDDTPPDGETPSAPDGDIDLLDDETDLGDNDPLDDVPTENETSIVGEAAAEQTQAAPPAIPSDDDLAGGDYAPPADLDDELLISLQEASTIGLTSSLTPRYGPNGKFLAPIEAPAEGSVGISTRAELEAIKNNLSGKYHLLNDIDLSGNDWVPIGGNNPFTGTFDGWGHVIRNLTISGNEAVAGLFAQANNATIKSVGLENTNININSSFDIMAGSICSIAFSATIISNCYNTGDVYVYASASESNALVSGICESLSSDTTISYCYNTGKVSVSAEDAYAFGIGSGTISNCYNTGEVSAFGNSYVSAAGIGGSGTISNCYNNGNVNASKDNSVSDLGNAHAGGISTLADIVNNCYNTGNVSAASDKDRVEAGGVCATALTISNSYNTGNVTAVLSDSSATYSTTLYGPFVGGICGYSGGIIRGCYNTGDVSAFSDTNIIRVGGICGRISSGNINSCYNTGSVTGTGDTGASSNRVAVYASGIYNVFRDDAAVSNCYNIGEVSAVGYDVVAAGIGGSRGAVNNCYNMGAVSAVGGSSASAIGIGDSGGTINNCYNMGAVSASGSSSNVGGISRASTVPGTTLTNCYWNSDSDQTVKGSPQSPKKGVASGTDPTTPLTTAEMKSASSFTGFDFDTVWAISRSANGGFPYLRALPVPADPDSGLVNARIDESAHHITVASSKNKKIPRATVTIDGQSHTTDSNGRLRYTGNYGEKTVTVSAAGYRASEQRYNLKKGAARTIYLEAEAGDGKPYVTMASDLGTGDDLRYQTRCYQTGDSKTIRIQAKGNWGSHSAGNFVLYQDGGKKLTTASGLFEFAPGKVFAANKPIKLKMVPASGTESAPVTLKLEVGTTFTESGLDNLSSYKITDDKEGSVTDKDALKLFPGDYTLQISSLPIKIKKEVKADGTVVYKGTIGINSDNYLRDDGAWTSYKKDFEKASKNLANTKKLYDYMTMLGGASGYFNVEKKLMKPKINGVGYFEIRYDKNGREIQSSGGVIVAGSSNGALTRQFLLGPIPIYYCALKQ